VHCLLGKLAALNCDELKKICFVRTLAATSDAVSDDDFAAIKVAGYTDAQLVDISLGLRNDRLHQRLRSYQRHRYRLPQSRKATASVQESIKYYDMNTLSNATMNPFVGTLRRSRLLAGILTTTSFVPQW
jgi:hypothetical protein